MSLTQTLEGGLIVPHAVGRTESVTIAPRWTLFGLLLASTGHLEPTVVFLGFLALAAACVGSSGLRMVVPPLGLWLPLVGLLAVGALAAWLAPRAGGRPLDVRDALRDAWRYGQPVLLVGIGWMLVRRREDLDGLFAAILVGATVASSIHLVGAVLNLDQLAVGRHAFRQEVGSGSFLSALALALVFGLRLERARGLRLPLVLQCVALGVCAASLLLSFSRTWWLAALVLFGVLLVRRSGSVRSWGTSLVTAFAVVAGALLVLPEESLGLLTGSLQDALVETMTARSYVEPVELNRFWRSYEAWCAVEQIQAAPAAAKTVGAGLGARLDLGMYQLLDGELRREIPVLHNGYLEVTLKAGLVGLGLYALWLVQLLRAGLRLRPRDARARVVASLVVGLALVLVGTGQVVGGATNPRATAGLVVLLAALLRWGQVAGWRFRKGPEAVELPT